MVLKRADFPTYLNSTSVEISGAGTYFCASATSQTVTLPKRVPTVSPEDIAIYRIVALSSASPVTITRSSSDVFNLGGIATVTSFILNPGESVDIMNNGLTWVAIFSSPPPAVYRKVKSVSGTTQTLDRSASMWSFTGSAATVWTLPALANNTGLEFSIKNKGSADITLQRAGADNLYTTAAVTSITITAGNSARVVNDGAHWVVL
ncbi:hypothetical protein L1080_004285 [Rhodococcus sp. MSC1_016]|jgi:hypothetical protein|uniref:hypothetical protein n=1 Tax=Rhodococcus sp. MSC1_016 TaxID=2909266 RepID=UPI002030CB18|nr:hypothetical protein [Rhodococcus sp. MSC1_016]